MKPGDLVQFTWGSSPDTLVRGIVLQTVKPGIPGIKYSVEILEGEMRYWYDVWEDEKIQKFEVLSETR